MQGRLNDPGLSEEIKNYAEYMLPQMYAARWPDGTLDSFGAASVEQTYSPWWYGNWSDVKHLNHGGDSHEGIWIPRTVQNWRVLDYIGRAMEWSVREFDVDGFRVDHTYGMPFPFLEQILPRVERRTRALLLVHEDHNRKRYTAGVGDVVQANGYSPSWKRSRARTPLVSAATTPTRRGAGSSSAAVTTTSGAARPSSAAT